MKIAQIAPVVERIPPKKYGGTERVIHTLTEELVRRGHEVTLFATGDSQTSARLVSVVARGLRESKAADLYGFNTQGLLNIGIAYSRHKEFDIIHDHNPHVGLPTANVVPTPTVLTWHGPYDESIVRFFGTLSRPNLVSISRSQAELAKGLHFAGTVYNGLSMQEYPWSASHDGYLIFVGRIDMQKGVHFAMDAAIALRKKLLIAAKLDESIPHIKRYFDEYIEPRLRAHPKLLEWIGEVEERERNELLSRAECLLHAVTWPEPFGLTLIEAAACGCPVVAFRQGAIPEIVQHGLSGFVVDNVAQMVEAVQKIDTIDRALCRAHVLRNFSAKRMADGYEAIYKRLVQAPYARPFSESFKTPYRHSIPS